MKYVFTAVLEPEGGKYNVSFPDLPGCVTSGDDLPDAVTMAEDALNLWLTDLEESGEPVPEASLKIDVPAGARTTLVLADTDEYRKLMSNLSVRKNVSLPAWLATTAERKNINFSQTLQDALKRELGIAGR